MSGFAYRLSRITPCLKVEVLQQCPPYRLSSTKRPWARSTSGSLWSFTHLKYDANVLWQLFDPLMAPVLCPRRPNTSPMLNPMTAQVALRRVSKTNHVYVYSGSTESLRSVHTVITLFEQQ